MYTRMHAETDAQPALRRQRRRYTQTMCIRVCVCARTHTHTHTQKQTGGGSHSQREGLADGAETALRLTPPLSLPQPLVSFLLPWAQPGNCRLRRGKGKGGKRRREDRRLVVKGQGAGGHLFVTSTRLLQVGPLFSTALALLVLDLDAVLLLLLLLFLFLVLLLQVFLGALTLRGAFSGYGQGSLPQQGVLLLRQLLLCLLGVGGGLPWQLPRLGKDLEAEPGGPSAGRGAQPCSPSPRRVYSCTSPSPVATQPIQSFDVDRKRQGGDFPGAPVAKKPPVNL